MERYLWALGDGWEPGREFDEFKVDYRGHHLLVSWAEPGIAAYRPDCHPNCRADLNLNSRTLMYKLKLAVQILTFLPSKVRVPLPL